jgi:hypothetical protein
MIRALLPIATVLLASVAAFTFTTAAYADDLVKVETIGPWSIAYNKDKDACNAYTQFGDTQVAFGHREDAGIWHIALFPPWSHWFADNETISVNITFDNGRQLYSTRKQVT